MSIPFSKFSDNFLKFFSASYEKLKYHIRPLVNANVPIWYSNESLGNWRDKAGGYGIQEPFGALAVKRIEGDYFNVVGLPVSSLYSTLKELELI